MEVPDAHLLVFPQSATEIVYALGLQDQLYGVTFECDYPPAARTKPIVVEHLWGDVAEQRRHQPAHWPAPAGRAGHL